MSLPRRLPAGPESRSTTPPNADQPGRSAPLVIVSEQGRHSDEARRIVRAQAARASAAQSRVTRARNRGERDVTTQATPFSASERGSMGRTTPSEASSGQTIGLQTTPDDATSASQSARTQAVETVSEPLVSWLSSVFDMTVPELIERVQSGTSSPLTRATSMSFATGSTALDIFGSTRRLEEPILDPGRLQLPRAVPRGFALLGQQIQLSDSFMALSSRTACFDFASPGVEARLHQLLFDLIVGYTGIAFSPTTSPAHPIRDHLRVACTCLTIFQGQRADGAIFAYESKYQRGLDAAWSEATLLDQNALMEPKAGKASLWAVLVIVVTTGSPANLFLRVLHSLIRDLRIDTWEQIRVILQDFIYPSSFLDEPCRIFYNSLQRPSASATYEIRHDR